MSIFDRFNGNKPSEEGIGAYAIYDSAAASFGMPLFFHTAGLAIRDVQDAVRNPATVLAKFPVEHSLFYIGRYVPVRGEFILIKAPERIVGCAELLEVNSKAQAA